MKINEVEALVGITKKNIRFYDEQGLLMPRRNSENGYRDYSQENVRTLQQIKLMRKLGLPIEEIRQMLSGSHTVADGIRRHLITLKREQQNVEQSIALCTALQDQQIRLEDLDAAEVLTQMQALEQTGTSFQNKHRQDIRVRYVAPVIIAGGMIAIMLCIAVLICWGWSQTAFDVPLLIAGILAITVCIAVCLGTLLALSQRIREIREGETDEAKQY